MGQYSASTIAMPWCLSVQLAILGWKSYIKKLPKLVTQEIGLQFYIYPSSLPEYLEEYFVPYTCSFNTRGEVNQTAWNSKVLSRLSSLQKLKYSFAYSAPKIWNYLTLGLWLSDSLSLWISENLRIHQFTLHMRICPLKLWFACSPTLNDYCLFSVRLISICFLTLSICTQLRAI